MIDFCLATPDDREQVLGRAFRNIYVFAFGMQGEHWRTDCLLEGRPVTLIGEPEQSLRTFLAGNDGAEVAQ